MCERKIGDLKEWTITKIILFTHLVPSDQQLCLRILEESPDVCPAEGDSSQAEAKNHGYGHLKVRPLAGVVACPHGAYKIQAKRQWEYLMALREQKILIA